MASILLDEKQDPELRIAAFIILMNKANEETINFIRKLLEKEAVNQVGSFIYTYLQNIAETSDPLKQELKNIVENSQFSDRFSGLSPFQFSRNLEKSFYAGTLNLGGQAESNIIWSNDSILPRRVNLNFTINWFGRQVNLLELGLRGMNIQQYLSEFLGYAWNEKETTSGANNTKKRFPLKNPMRKDEIEWVKAKDHWEAHKRFKRGAKMSKDKFDKLAKIERDVCILSSRMRFSLSIITSSCPRK